MLIMQVTCQALHIFESENCTPSVLGYVKKDLQERDVVDSSFQSASHDSLTKISIAASDQKQALSHLSGYAVTVILSVYATF